MIKVHRIGKYNTNRRVPRPLRVVFQDKFERNKVVRNASNLNSQRSGHIYCFSCRVRLKITNRHVTFIPVVI